MVLFEMRLLTRHIWSELVPSCAEGIVLLTFIFLLKKMFDILTGFIDTGAQLSNLAGLFILMIPPVCLLTLPMAVLLGTLLSYGRLSEENEITAMEAGGISLARIYLPAIIFGALVTAFLLFWSHVITPKSLRLTQQAIIDIYQKTATGGITPGRFMNLGELTLICERMDSESKKLYGTSIFEKGKNGGIAALVTSPTANFQLFPKRGELMLDLRAVTLHRTRAENDRVEESDQESDQIVLADRMQWRTDVQRMVRRIVSKTTKESQYYTPSALIEEIKTVNLQKKELLKERDRLMEVIRSKSNAPKAKQFLANADRDLASGEKRLIRLRMERVFRIALPFAAVLMAAIAAPLGVLMRRGRRGIAFAVTILLVLVYYVLLSLGKALAADAVLSPWLGLWLPNFAAMLMAAGIYRKTVNP